MGSQYRLQQSGKQFVLVTWRSSSVALSSGYPAFAPTEEGGEISVGPIILSKTFQSGHESGTLWLALLDAEVIVLFPGIT